MNRIEAIAAVLRWNYEPRLEDTGDYEFVALAILGALGECERTTRTEEVDAVFAKLRNSKISALDGTARPDGVEAGAPLQGGSSVVPADRSVGTTEEAPDHFSSPGALPVGEDAAAPEPLPPGTGAAAPLDPDPPINHLTPAFRCDDCDGDEEAVFRRLARLGEHTIDEHGRSPYPHEKTRRKA